MPPVYNFAALNPALVGTPPSAAIHRAGPGDRLFTAFAHLVEETVQSIHLGRDEKGLLEDVRQEANLALLEAIQASDDLADEAAFADVAGEKIGAAVRNLKVT